MLGGLWLRIICGVLGLALVFGAVQTWRYGNLKERYEDLVDWQNIVVLAIRTVSGKATDPRDASAQVYSFGNTMQRAAGAVGRQSQSIRQIGEDSARYKAEGERVRRELQAAIRQRNAARARLADEAASPGDQRSAQAMLDEANRVADAIYGAGL